MQLIFEGEDVCTPCVTEDRIYFGGHRGTSIWSIDHNGGDLREEFRLEDSECCGHISSPFVVDNKMYYHGPARRTGSRQRTYVAYWNEEWIASGEGALAYPYYQQFGKYGLAKYRGIQFYEGYKPIKRVNGRFRHCHVNNGWLYYSSIGDKPESIYRVRMDDELNIDWTQCELVISPPLKWGPVRETVSGYATHPWEVRDPFVYNGVIYFIGRGEKGIYREDLHAS